jgi:hypothetical protein
VDVVEVKEGRHLQQQILVSLATVIHKTIMMLKTWRPLLKPKNLKLADELMGKLWISIDLLWSSLVIVLASVCSLE